MIDYIRKHMIMISITETYLCRRRLYYLIKHHYFIIGSYINIYLFIYIYLYVYI